MTEKPKESTHEFKSEDGITRVGCWLSATQYWCDFKLFEVSSWDSKNNVGSWGQIREGENCDLFDCKVMAESDPIVTGYIKWDGCMEFEVPRQHFCDAPDSLQEFHAYFQWMLRAAHSAMGGPDMWKPLSEPETPR